MLWAGRDALLTARDAAHALQTTIPVILMWRNRGWVDADGQQRRLATVGRDHLGRKLYRWGELVDAERDTRNTRARVGLPPRARLGSGRRVE